MEVANSPFFIPELLSIRGGNPVYGSVNISGAKNAILGLMAASLLTDEPVTINNVPYISDVLEMGHIMKELGVDVRYAPQKRILYLHARKITSNVISEKAVHFRASYYLWGSLLARFVHTGEFDSLKVLMPGGCSFGGKRRTDFHEQLIKSVFNAEISEEPYNSRHYLCFSLPKNKVLGGNPVYATFKASHGATYHWMLSVAGASEIKMMYNSSMEPEISNLMMMLQQMGLGLSGNERTGLIYDGKNRGLLHGGTFYAIPDRMEAATYALLAVGTKGEIQIENINFDNCRPWFSQLYNMFESGVYYSPDKTQLNLNFRNRADFNGVIMQMSPFPGMETDLQQIWTPILGQASSESFIADLIWPGRIAHLEQMRKFGLQTEAEQREVKVSQEMSDKVLLVKIKPSQYKAADVEGMDLRGTMGLIIMAAMTEGKSKVTTPSYALRGYPNLIKNLQDLGVNISASAKGSKIEPLPEYLG